MLLHGSLLQRGAFRVALGTEERERHFIMISCILVHCIYHHTQSTKEWSICFMTWTMRSISGMQMFHTNFSHRIRHVVEQGKFVLFRSVCSAKQISKIPRKLLESSIASTPCLRCYRHSPTLSQSLSWMLINLDAYRCNKPYELPTAGAEKGKEDTSRHRLGFEYTRFLPRIGIRISITHMKVERREALFNNLFNAHGKKVIPQPYDLIRTCHSNAN